ncbi:hypothetical protein DL767_004735 [Monosporascus sp. MG133]|nr:hypothetical protein DL767_004735 [Monosporascus sp. MG133]
MASSQAVRVGEELHILKDQLYEACQQAFAGDYERALSQDDLMGLDIIPPKDIKKLMDVVSLLTRERLFAPVNLHSGLAWRMRPETEAAKYKLLTSQEQVLVYEIIDAAGAEGAWQQDIKRRLNMQDTALRKALKELETKRLVSQFTTVENASKKMWIKAHIKPSARATGGPFYTDSYLDEPYIEELQRIIVAFVKERGSYLSTGRAASPILPKKGVIKGSASEAAVNSRKRPADAMADDNPAPPPKVHRTVRLPLPAGYNDYTTVEDLAEAIASTGIAKGQALKPEHIQELVDVLVWEGRLEQVRVGDRVGYRAARLAKSNPARGVKLDAEDYWKPRTNGLTTVPCGRCPVFELCEEGGPVWAGGCEYFDQWLA